MLLWFLEKANNLQEIGTKHNFLAQIVKKLWLIIDNPLTKHFGQILFCFALFGASDESPLGLRLVTFPP